MHDAYKLTAGPDACFDVLGFVQAVARLPHVARRPGGAATEYLVGRSAEEVAGVVALLANDPRAPLPAIGVIEVTAEWAHVRQGADGEILSNVRPLVERLVRQTPCAAQDAEGRDIPLPPDDPLGPLFG